MVVNSRFREGSDVAVAGALTSMDKQVKFRHQPLVDSRSEMPGASLAQFAKSAMTFGEESGIAALVLLILGPITARHPSG
jgi:hypothetical protein